MVCQLVSGYFMPKGLGFAYIVHPYLHFLCNFLIFLHTIIYQIFLSNTNNLQTSIGPIDGS